MVVKTELCAFSEYRIYPGHGIRMIRKDGQPVTLISSKCKSMLRQRKKPAKLTWTQTWRTRGVCRSWTLCSLLTRTIS